MKARFCYLLPPRPRDRSYRGRSTVLKKIIISPPGSTHRSLSTIHPIYYRYPQFAWMRSIHSPLSLSLSLSLSHTLSLSLSHSLSHSLSLTLSHSLSLSLTLSHSLSLSLTRYDLILVSTRKDIYLHLSMCTSDDLLLLDKSIDKNSRNRHTQEFYSWNSAAIHFIFVCLVIGWFEFLIAHFRFV